MLIFIYYFKNILSISDIQTLLGPITEKYFKSVTEKDMTYIYQEVFSMEQSQIRYLEKDLCAVSKVPEKFLRTPTRRIRNSFPPVFLYSSPRSSPLRRCPNHQSLNQTAEFLKRYGFLKKRQIISGSHIRS